MADALTERLTAVSSIIPLIGDRVLVVHGPASTPEEATLSGRDVDCAVDGIDPMWPLRLTDGWMLCQSLHYDLCGWYWVVSRGGRSLAFDTVDDPLGLGRDGLRTAGLLELTGRDAPALQAAYLAVKRARKHSLDEAEWRRIATLAQQDAAVLPEVFERVAGRRVAELLGPFAIGGTAPDRRTARRANSLRTARRFSSPARVGLAVALGVSRYAWRIRYPTGLLVVVAGPDGAGKSALAERLPGLCAAMFKRHVHEHWRPGLLPRPGAFLGRRPSDPAEPHARETYGRVISTLLLGYYWLDFLLGGWLLDWPVRFRTGLVVRERGWWDIAVDPRRYRLQPAPRLVRLLGRTLKRPDVFLVLEARPETLLSRKTELPLEELADLQDRWRHTPPRRAARVHLDASRPLEEVARAAREHIFAFLEARAISRLGAGWLALPAGSPRWWLPRGPRAVAVAGLHVYQPVTPKAKAGWSAAHALARMGGFRQLPRGAAPPKELRDVLASHLPGGSTIAVTRANAPGRYVAMILDRNGVSTAIAKVATDPRGVRALASEAAAIRSLAGLLSSPVSAPELLLEEPGLLLLEPVRWRPRVRPWVLDEEVAYALGKFFRRGATDGDRGSVGPAHGDCAPWNLLRTDSGWVLVDWESAASDAPPFFDVCHWVIRSHALLGHPSRSVLLGGFRDGRGWVGRAIAAYAEGAGIEASATGALERYARLDQVPSPTTREESRALERRRGLLDLLRG